MVYYMQFHKFLLLFQTCGLSYEIYGISFAFPKTWTIICNLWNFYSISKNMVCHMQFQNFFAFSKNVDYHMQFLEFLSLIKKVDFYKQFLEFLSLRQKC